MNSNNSGGPPRNPNGGSQGGSYRGPSSGAPQGPRQTGNFSGPRNPSSTYQGNNYNRGPNAGASSGPGAGPNSGPAGGASGGGSYQPRPQGGGYAPRPAGAGGYAPRPQGGGYGAPRPFTPRGTGYVKEKSKDDLRINNEINVPQVRLVGADGEMVGVVPTAQALQMADEAGLDLVEVSPQAEPPVCKIIDYGKYKYEQEKKASEARKKQKVIEIKELKLRPTIGDHDYQIKIKQAKEFLTEGDKVKFTLRFKGREMSHSEIGTALMARVKADLEGLAKVDQEPKFEGRQVIMVVSPAKV